MIIYVNTEVMTTGLVINNGAPGSWYILNELTLRHFTSNTEYILHSEVLKSVHIIKNIQGHIDIHIMLHKKKNILVFTN